MGSAPFKTIMAMLRRSDVRQFSVGSPQFTTVAVEYLPRAFLLAIAARRTQRAQHPLPSAEHVLHRGLIVRQRNYDCFDPW
jgi:hypothetical protein